MEIALKILSDWCKTQLDLISRRYITPHLKFPPLNGREPFLTDRAKYYLGNLKFINAIEEIEDSSLSSKYVLKQNGNSSQDIK